MDNKKSHPNGVVTVSDRAVMQIAAYAARQCPGVAAMSERSRKGETLKSVMGCGDSAGVYVKKTKSGVVLDVYIACRPGADTQQLKNDTAFVVTSAFTPTGIRIQDVNIHINSVR